MTDSVYDLNTLNLALDGTLEQFKDVYDYTYTVYQTIIEENGNVMPDTEELDRIAIPALVDEYMRLANKRLRMFTKNVKWVNIDASCFKVFSFVDSEKIKHFQWEYEWNLSWKNEGHHLTDEGEWYLKHDNGQFKLSKTAMDLDGFLKQFKLVVVRGVFHEIREDNPDYTPFDARRDVDARIKQRMKMRRDEYRVVNDADARPSKEPLWLYDSLVSTSCKRFGHKIEPAVYYAQSSIGVHVVKLPVHHCKNCNKYLMGKLSLSMFEACFGKFIVTIVRDELSRPDYREFQSESKLHLLGYNVREGKMSAIQRQSLLVYILEENRLSFFEVVATIENNIMRFQKIPRFYSAVQKWKDDLKFLSEYSLKKQLSK